MRVAPALSMFQAVSHGDLSSRPTGLEQEFCDGRQMSGILILHGGDRTGTKSRNERCGPGNGCGVAAPDGS
jgi:hypothetical protein